MDALIWMAVALLIVVLFDGALLMHARHHE
jgi:hypothetical protein